MRVPRKGYELSRKYKLVNSLKYGHYQTVHPHPLTLTHPHPPPPNPPYQNFFKNVPYTPTHPDPPKMTSHPPPNNSHSLKIMLQ